MKKTMFSPLATLVVLTVFALVLISAGHHPTTTEIPTTTSHQNTSSECPAGYKKKEKMCGDLAPRVGFWPTPEQWYQLHWSQFWTMYHFQQNSLNLPYECNTICQEEHPLNPKKPHYIVYPKNNTCQAFTRKSGIPKPVAGVCRSCDDGVKFEVVDRRECGLSRHVKHGSAYYCSPKDN